MKKLLYIAVTFLFSSTLKAAEPSVDLELFATQEEEVSKIDDPMIKIMEYLNLAMSLNAERPKDVEMFIIGTIKMFDLYTPEEMMSNIITEEKRLLYQSKIDENERNKRQSNLDVNCKRKMKDVILSARLTASNGLKGESKRVALSHIENINALLFPSPSK